jgi:replication factor C subunit 1
MRLKVSGDKREIRQSYIPVLLRRLTEPLLERGNDGIEDVIREMDEYYLTKEEWDAVVELGVGENTPDPILKQIKPATKTAFTRKYNGTDHPIPFHKGTDIATSKRVARDTERPDLEEAFEVEVEEADDEEKKPKKGEDEDTIKDKLVKAKKPKATKAATAKAKAPAKPKATKK